MSFFIQMIVRALVFLILFASIGLVGRAFGEGWPTNYQHFNQIRSIAKSCPKGTHIRVTLNNGDIVFVTFLKYEKYNDYIWYQPLNTSSWFVQDAFDVHEVSTIEIVEPI